MDNERLNKEIEKEHMKRSFKQKNIRKFMFDDTKKLIKSFFPDLKGEGLKGNGLKKNCYSPQ